MNDLVWRLSRYVDLVLELFKETLFTANLCLLLESPRKFVECEKDSGCVEKSIAGFVDVYVWQLLNNKSDLKDEE